MSETLCPAYRSRASIRACQRLLATIAVGMALGVALNFSAIDPIRTLYLERGAERCGGGAGDRHDAATDHATVVVAGFTLPLPLQGRRLATAAMVVTVVAMIASWLE